MLDVDAGHAGVREHIDTSADGRSEVGIEQLLRLIDVEMVGYVRDGQQFFRPQHRHQAAGRGRVDQSTLAPHARA